MIDFRPSIYKRTSKGINVLKYDEIESITEELLKDYDSSYLTTPKQLEMEDFAINYLEAREVDYQYIWTDSPSINILGMTTFNDCKIVLTDEKRMMKESCSYGKHSIILDRSLVDGARDAQFGITAFHECGHLYLHKHIYEETEGQISLNIENNKTVCTRADVEIYKKKKIVTAQDWLEWQATIFAVTISLNKNSVSVFMNELFIDNGIKRDFLLIDDPDDYGFIYNYVLPEISQTYGISKEAILYRLMKLEYIKTTEENERDKAQMTIYQI